MARVSSFNTFYLVKNMFIVRLKFVIDWSTNRHILLRILIEWNNQLAV